MEPILDESSLVPCEVHVPGTRILQLTKAMQALDKLGLPRVLRTVKDAADRDVGDAHGLRFWCFDKTTDRDAGRLLAGRLAQQPHIDGPGGLFTDFEGSRVVEPRVDGALVFGLGLSALTDGVAVRLGRAAEPSGRAVEVTLLILDDDGERTEATVVETFVTAGEVESKRTDLISALDRAVDDGEMLLARAAEMFPYLILGPRVIEQAAAWNGTEPYFAQILRHLRALDDGAREWPAGQTFDPKGVTFSVESQPTLNHKSYGPMRKFPMPAGFAPRQFSLHTKLTGGPGARLYFWAERTPEGHRVLVGYCGPHLPTVLDPT